MGAQTAENVQVSVADTGGVSVNKKWDVGRMNAYETKTVSSTVTISKDAYIGLHNIQVKINYDGFDSYGKREDNQQSTWDFPVRVYVNANFQIAVQNNVFSKDATGKLLITGTTQQGAKSVSATLTSNSASCASVVGSSKVFVGDVVNDQNFKLEYNVKPSDVGVCSFNLLMDYSDISGNSMTENLAVSIDVQRNDIDFKVTGVSYTGSSPGTASNVTVSLENLGMAPARDVSVTMQLASPFTPIGSPESYVGTVGDHGKADVDFQLQVDSAADVKAYVIPLTIDYFDAAGTKYTVTKTIGLELSGKPDLQIFLERNDALTPGGTGIVTISIVNKGLTEVKFLSVKLLPTDNYDTTPPAEAYIGNLDSDATVTQDYVVAVKKGASPGAMPLKIQLKYKEANSNDDSIETADVDVNVLSAKDYAAMQPSSTMPMLITIGEALIGIVVVVLVLSFVFRSKPSAKNSRGLAGKEAA